MWLNLGISTTVHLKVFLANAVNTSVTNIFRSFIQVLQIQHLQTLLFIEQPSRFCKHYNEIKIHLPAYFSASSLLC